MQASCNLADSEFLFDVIVDNAFTEENVGKEKLLKITAKFIR